MNTNSDRQARLEFLERFEKDVRRRLDTAVDRFAITVVEPVSARYDRTAQQIFGVSLAELYRQTPEFFSTLG